MQTLILLGTLIIPTASFMLMDLAQRQLGKQSIPVLVLNSDRRTDGTGEVSVLD